MDACRRLKTPNQRHRIVLLKARAIARTSASVLLPQAQIPMSDAEKAKVTCIHAVGWVTAELGAQGTQTFYNGKYMWKEWLSLLCPTVNNLCLALKRTTISIIQG